MALKPQPVADPPLRGARYVVLYDGVCDLCHSGVAWLRARDRWQRFEFLPYQSPGVRERFPALDPDAIARAMHVVSPEGEVRSGVDAASWILGNLPGWNAVARVLAWPVARHAARPIYAWIAARRHWLGRAPSCSYPRDDSGGAT